MGAGCTGGMIPPGVEAAKDGGRVCTAVERCGEAMEMRNGSKGKFEVDRHKETRSRGAPEVRNWPAGWGADREKVSSRQRSEFAAPNTRGL